MGSIHHANAKTTARIWKERQDSKETITQLAERFDRVCKYAYAELHERMTQEIARDFLGNLIADCPFKIHKILTDNGAQFTYALLAEHLRPKNKVHMFDRLCKEHKIEHRLTKFRHPWTNGQVEIMNKKIKAHTTKRYHYETQESLKKHLMAYLWLIIFSIH